MTLIGGGMMDDDDKMEMLNLEHSNSQFHFQFQNSHIC